VLTGGQIRAARAFLRWSSLDLAQNAGVGIQTIKRFEATDGVPPSRSSTLMDVQTALEKAGIEFIGAHDDSPGIRIRTPRAPVEP
jgi:transcriptional regulator with XRE-family HTH domain